MQCPRATKRVCNCSLANYTKGFVGMIIALDNPGDIDCCAFGVDWARRRAELIRALLFFNNLNGSEGVWLVWGCCFRAGRLNRSWVRRSTGLAPEDITLYCYLT
jgi:hypothetical protein